MIVPLWLGCSANVAAADGVGAAAEGGHGQSSSEGECPGVGVLFLADAGVSFRRRNMPPYDGAPSVVEMTWSSPSLPG